MNGIQGNQKSESALDANQPIGIGLKRCTKCGEVKPLSEFCKDKIRKDGHTVWCKECKKKSNQEWYAVNSEEQNKKSQDWWRAHSQKINRYRQKKYAANPEKFKEAQKKWQKANPEKCAELRRNKRARKRNAEGKHTAKDIQKIFDRQGELCNACGKKLIRYNKKQYHVDHIIPLAKGGGNGPDNLQLLCPYCNMTKSDKNPVQWARENGRLF